MVAVPVHLRRYIDQPGGFPSPEGTPTEDLPMGIAMAYKYGVKLCHSIRQRTSTPPPLDFHGMV